ncbi:MAG: hypothetical protein COA78_09350 [Blastopirellula sp.]|nr:MAG: hypothetical protein COA78_09350 [Blastopirellula sp.]
MNEFWNNIIYSVFGEELPPEADGLQSSIQWSAPWAPWITLALIIASTLYIAWIYQRERATTGAWIKVLLTGIRLSLIGILLFMLYGLTLRPFRTDMPDLIIAIDDTLSMGHIDSLDPETDSEIASRVSAAGFEDTSRWNQALTLLTESDAALLKQLTAKYRPKFYLIGDSSRPVSIGSDDTGATLKALAPTQSTSRLGDSLQEILEAQRGRPTAAIIVFTDGVTTEGKLLNEAAQYAKIRGIPLHLIGLGSSLKSKDLQLDDLSVDQVAFVGDTLNFSTRLSATGFQGKSVRVVLKRKENDKPLAEQQITVTSDEFTRVVRLQFRPKKKGVIDFVVQVEIEKDEINVNNNQEEQTVMVRDDTIKVLYVQAYPRFQYRYLKTLLERQLKPSSEEGVPEHAFELTTILQDADTEYADQDSSAIATFPNTAEELFQYDVLIFGDANPAFLNRLHLDNINQFVSEKGGGAIFIAGTQYMPWNYKGTALEPLLPFDIDSVRTADVGQDYSTPFSLTLTELGMGSPPLQVGTGPTDNIRLWNEIPHLYWFLNARKKKPAAQTLLAHDAITGDDGQGLPILSQQFVGNGKVLFLATDDLWRWEHHDAFWMQSIRYLARSALAGSDRAAELTTSRQIYRKGEVAKIRLRFFDERKAPASDDGVTIVVEHDKGRRQRIGLSRSTSAREVFDGSMGNLMPGSYRVWVAEPNLSSAATDNQPPAAVFTVEAPVGEMARLEMDEADLKAAALSSGGKFYLFTDTLSLASNLPPGRQVKIETLPPTPLWNSWKLAMLFTSLIITEWLLRKRYGML